MPFQTRRRLLILPLAAALAITMPGIARAHGATAESEETPVVTQVTSTLPVLASGLTVSLTRDANGAISVVAINPSTGSTIVKENDHRVVFLLSDGDTEVVVKSAGAVVQTRVKADATADVAGAGGWSADVFGTGAVTIPYAVSFNGNAPVITVGSIVVPSGVTAEIGDPKIKSSDERSSYRVKVKLTSGDQRAVVELKATTRIDDVGGVHVDLSVTLIEDRGRGHDDDRNNGDDDNKHDDDRERGSGDRSNGRGGGDRSRGGDRDHRGGGDSHDADDDD